MNFQLDYSQLQQLYPLIIPGLLGLIIPLLVNAVSRVTDWPDWLQSIIYAALSALAGVVPTVAFDGDLKGYMIAVFIAWIASMRSHYTKIPDGLIKPYKPRHALDENNRQG